MNMQKSGTMKELYNSLPARIFIITFTTTLFASTNAQSKTNTAAWTSHNPFQHNVFIENAGQIPDLGNQHVFFVASVDGMTACFTAQGLTYKYGERYLPEENEKKERKKNERRGEKEEEEFSKMRIRFHYLGMKWEDASSTSEITTEGKETFYYSYPAKDGHSSITANCYKKIIYKNLYVGIDAEYILPEKGGVKYNLVIHPGADLSKVQIRYIGAKKLTTDKLGNITVHSKFGADFMEHAPVSYYENGEPIASAFELKGNAILFSLSNQSTSANPGSIIVDPWISVVKFPASSALLKGFDNRGFDVDYDNQGNVWVFGGGDSLCLAKFNSAGALLWIYVSNSSGTYLVGDFTLNKASGTAYIGDGYNNSGGARVYKVNTLGKLIATGKNPNFVIQPTEISRIRLDCSGKLYMSMGGVPDGIWQVSTIDTNLQTFNGARVTTSPNGDHDMNLMTLDPTGGFMYFNLNYPAPYSVDYLHNNEMHKIPLPNFTPNSWINKGPIYSFEELGSLNYAGLAPIGGNPNRCRINMFNGMICGNNFLYTYNGDTIKKWNKGSGAMIAWVKTGGKRYSTGGLDLDRCENIYASIGNAVEVYDINLNKIKTYALPDTSCYDIRVNTIKNVLYACGTGYVCEIALDPAIFQFKLITTPASNCAQGAASVEVSQFCNPEALLYKWAPGGQTTASLTGLAAGTYSVTVTFPAFSCLPSHDTSFVVTIKTDPNPKVFATATKVDVLCNGLSTGSASVAATGGTTGYTYSWTPGGASSATLTGLAAGTYSCDISKSSCADTTIVITITQPPAITHTKNSTVATCGKTNGTAIVTSAGGTPAYSYSWNTGSNTSNLNNLKSGIYTVSTTDANGCKDTLHITVPAVSAFTTSSAKVDVLCYGGNNGSANAIVSGGTLPITYMWNNGQTGSTASSLVAGTYTCVVNDNTGSCPDTITVTLTQPTKLLLQATASPAICFGSCDGKGNLVAAGGTTPYTYSWSNGAATNSATTLCKGNYSVTLTDKNSCTHDTTINITEPTPVVLSTDSTSTTCGKKNGSALVNASGGSPTYTYIWNSGDTTSATSGKATGIYTVTVTDSHGCQNATAVNVPASPPFTASMGAATLLCNGDQNGNLSVTVAGSSAPYSFAWSNGAVATTTINNLSAGKYTVSITDVYGCTGIVVDSVMQPPPLVLKSMQQTMCDGGSATLLANASGGTAPYTYAWNNSNGNPSFIGNPSATTTYTVETMDANGCKVNTIDTINVIPLPTAAFGGSDVCVGIPTIFTDSSYISNGVISTWKWDFGDGNTAVSKNPTHTYTSPGSYKVTLVVSNGSCQTSTTRIVNVYPLSKADFSVDPPVASIEDPTFTIIDLSKGGVKGLWEFGDGIDSIYVPGTNHMHTYPAENIPGGETYTIRLTIVNQYGCPDAISKTIHIEPEWTFYVPDAVSPNGDGKNETFFGTGIGILEKEMWIFDRWGLLIFHTTDLNGAWDGKVASGSSNELVQQDVYVWKIRIKEIFGKTHTYLGHVTVVK